MATNSLNKKDLVTQKRFNHWRNSAVIGYAILAIGCASGIWAVTEKMESNIRNDLKKASLRNCEQVIIPASKNFNALLEEAITTWTDRNDEEVVARYEALILSVPSVEECATELLLGE